MYSQHLHIHLWHMAKEHLDFVMVLYTVLRSQSRKELHLLVGAGAGSDSGIKDS
jgi:hypothetical protein